MTRHLISTPESSPESPSRDLLSGDGFLHAQRPLTPDQERRFQADYYARIRPTLGLVSLLLAGLVAGQTLIQSSLPAPSDLAVAVPEFVFWLCVFGLTRARGFGQVWQPILVLGGWATAALVLEGLGRVLGGQGTLPHAAVGPQQKLFFVLQMAVLMVTLSTLRLPLRGAVLLQSGVLLIGLWSFETHLPANPVRDLHFILLPTLLLLLALLLTAFTLEQAARSAFTARTLLEAERDGERQAREQTQGHLRVLARAIGGIVHDLGNPLTVVQMGADLVDIQADSGDAAAIRQTNGAVRESAQMLGALRLSLMEQTRVLEGKPIPVHLESEPLRPIVEMGARFQSGRLTAGRAVALAGEYLEVHADRLKLAAVFMNLIGNALKYSDGEVCITWRASGDAVLVGVLDRGTGGRGVSEAQAAQLFAPFGRLGAHADVEGTGMGLVSARKIVEAHGGELFIEGHADGTPASLPFSTSQGRYPSLLSPDFVTGFVVACRAQESTPL